MALNEEQTEQIKQQLLKQIDNLPQEQRAQAKGYIESMDSEQLEQFLKQQTKEQKSSTTKTNQATQCIFCSIANKQINAFAIYEDKNYLAALEINPFSEGHTILIPKKHIKETKSLPAKALTLANKIGKHLIKKLKAKTFQVTTTADLHHAIVNIIPEYKEPITFQRKKSEEKQLQELAIKIGEVPKRASRKSKPKIISKNTEEPKTSNKENKPALEEYPRRIP